MSAARLKTQQSNDQCIDVFTSIVEGQRWPDGALHSHTAQDRLRTVVAGAHRDALLIKRNSNILGANVIENERHHASLLACCPDQPQTGYREQFSCAVIQ